MYPSHQGQQQTQQSQQPQQHLYVPSPYAVPPPPSHPPPQAGQNSTVFHPPPMHSQQPPMAAWHPPPSAGGYAPELSQSLYQHRHYQQQQQQQVQSLHASMQPGFLPTPAAPAAPAAVQQLHHHPSMLPHAPPLQRAVNPSHPWQSQQAWMLQQPHPWGRPHHGAALGPRTSGSARQQSMHAGNTAAATATATKRSSQKKPTGRSGKEREKGPVGKGNDMYGLANVSVPASVDESSLSQEDREFRQERRAQWPSRSNVERKKREEQERKERGELPQESLQKRRLREVLAKQRKLGHHEASRECTSVLTPCKFFVRGRCHKGRKCAFSHDPALKANAKHGQKRKRDQRGASHSVYASDNAKQVQHHQRKQQRGPDKGGLLRKILEPEMHAERSQLLQAFRFIVKNNFFLENDDPASVDYSPWDSFGVSEDNGAVKLQSQQTASEQLLLNSSTNESLPEDAGDDELDALALPIDANTTHDGHHDGDGFNDEDDDDHDGQVEEPEDSDEGDGDASEGNESGGNDHVDVTPPGQGEAKDADVDDAEPVGEEEGNTQF